MGRSVKRRRICGLPQNHEYVPAGRCWEETVEMTVDEFETIRLIDHMGLTQEDCALQMNVARTTIQSIYNSARSKLADVLVCGKRLVIRGGAYEVCPRSPQCCGRQCVGGNCEGRRCKGDGIGSSGKENCQGRKTART